MSAINFGHYPQFFTATILGWKHPREDAFKDIIMDIKKHSARIGMRVAGDKPTTAKAPGMPKNMLTLYFM